MSFVYFVYLIGLIVSVFQDFKRREIDDWLNLFLLFSGCLFVLLFQEYNISSLGFFIILTAGISLLFMAGRIFSGGDSKLLFALSPFFYSLNFGLSMFNFGIFILLLLISGSIYGFVYSLVLFIKNFSVVKKDFLLQLNKRYSIILFIFAFVLFLLALVDLFFLVFALFILFVVILFCITISLDKNVMSFQLSTKDLGEGDILVRDLKVGNKTFKANSRRLTEDEIEFLNGKNLKVWIKDGIPYALSFLIAFVIYYFKDVVLLWLFQKGF